MKKTEATNYFYLLTHFYDGGTQVELYKSLKGARKGFKQILTDYKNDGYDLNTSAKNDSELREKTFGSGIALNITKIKALD